MSARSVQDLMREEMRRGVSHERAQNARALSGRGRAARPGHAARPQYSERGAIDVHELLKREALGSKVASCHDHFEKSRPCPSEVYGVSDHYIVLDSFSKQESSKTWAGEFNFNFMVQGDTRDESIGTRDKIETAIAIQVGEFVTARMPMDVFDPAVLAALSPALGALNLAANTGGALSAVVDPADPQSQTPFQRVTLYLQELGRQAFIDRNHRRHQFEFSATQVGRDLATGETGDRLLLTPLRNYGYYVLTNPKQAIHELSLRFFNPDEPLRFPPDVLYGVAVSVDSALDFLQFSFTDRHNLINLATQDRIFVEGFELVHQSTAAAVPPAAPVVTVTKYGVLNSYINRKEGHLVGGDMDSGTAFALPAPSASGMTVTFRLDPDVDVVNSLVPATGLAPGSPLVLRPPPAAGPATNVSLTGRVVVRIAKNRTRIPVRIRGVVDRLTNYIAP